MQQQQKIQLLYYSNWKQNNPGTELPVPVPCTRRYCRSKEIVLPLYTCTTYRYHPACCPHRAHRGTCTVCRRAPYRRPTVLKRCSGYRCAGTRYNCIAITIVLHIDAARSKPRVKVVDLKVVSSVKYPVSAHVSSVSIRNTTVYLYMPICVFVSGCLFFGIGLALSFW